MARRRIKNDPREYIPTPEKQLEHPSGWCMTNDHAICKYQFDHGKCGCNCHTQPQKTQKTKEKVAIIANSDDPRPWRKQ